MKELAGRTAVVTGAASGIGLGIARALARAGVDLAVIDLEAPPLEAAREALAAEGVRVHHLTLDVADRDAVYAAAEEVERALGKVHILVNNAGIGFAGTPLDQIADGDYDWVIGVNIFGVIHGIKAFVPKIRAHGEGGHVVNTSSMSGLRLTKGWHHGLYSLTKAAVVHLSDGLRDDLEEAGIGVSVLCPEQVRTNIYQAGRNRPARFGGPYHRSTDHPLYARSQTGLDPDKVGEMVRWAIEENEPYILTHAHTRAQVEARFREIMASYDRWDAYHASHG